MNNRPDEASATAPKKKKKKKKQPFRESQTVNQLPIEQNDRPQPTFDPYNDDPNDNQSVNYFPAVSNHQDPDQEQPSSFPEMVPIKRHQTTYKMPVAANKRVQPLNGNTGGKNNGSSPSQSFCASLAYRMRSLRANMFRFKWLKLTQLLLATYIGILTFADIGPPGGLRDTDTGLIVDKASPERTANGLILVNGTERAIVAASLTQVACIGVARLSAWLMYPSKFLT